LQLQLHGDACVWRAGQPPWPLRGRAAALVALAALEPGISRERAAAMLWPDAPNPRQNLRQQLLRFRQALGQALVVGEDHLRLADGVGPTTPQARQGELLAGDLAVDEDFRLWLERQRRNDQQARRDPLAAALASAEESGDLDAALDQAQALLDLEPNEEAHHVALMRVHYLRGETAAGLLAFQRLCELLRGTVGSPPGPAAHQMAERLKASGARPSVPVSARATALPIALRRPPQLAGRDAALSALRQAWQHGMTVLIEGEAGMGKSRLLAEWLPAQTPGLLAGSGRPGDAGQPYATLARLLGPALASPPSTLTAGTRQALDHLTSSSPASRPAAQPLRPGDMNAAVAAYLDALAIEVVVLDDLHFADEATLELIIGLTAAEASGRRWLFANRPAETPAAARQLRDTLAESGRLAVIALTPLDAEATQSLLEGLAIPGLEGHALAPALVQHTGGNPLFMLETLKQGLVDGSLQRGLLPRPLGVGALIESRLQRLSEAALMLARVAAIAGVDFRIELAEAALGMRAVQMAGAWNELQQAQVLRDEAFAHDLVRDAVLRSVPAPVARRLHADVASFLQQQGGEPARLALHWEAAGRWPEARQALVAAAAAARAIGRFREQAALYLRAAQACEKAGDQTGRFEMLMERVQAFNIADDGDQALAAAAALEAEATSESQRLHAIACQANLYGLRMDHAHALLLGERGLALALRIGDHRARLDLACSLAYVLSTLQRHNEALDLLESLREWVESQGKPVDRQHWTTHMAIVATAMGRLHEGVRLHEISARLAQELDLVPELAMDYSNMADTYSSMGLYEEAVRVGSRATQLLQQENTGMPGRNLLGQARDLRNACRFDEALQHFDLWHRGMQNESSPVWRQVGAVWWAGLWVWLGQYARALQLLQDDDERGLDRVRAMGWIYRAQAHRAIGQGHEASLRRAQELSGNPGGATLAFALVPLALASPEAALEIAVESGRQAREGERTGVLMHARLCEAEAAARLGLHDQVRAAAQDALHWLAQGYAPDATLYRGEFYLRLWQTLHAVGQRETAARVLRLGGTWLQERALPHVPAPFIESFLHRHPVNRELLAALART
jgi:DNA-binding SARP family transcriptional activator